MNNWYIHKEILPFRRHGQVRLYLSLVDIYMYTVYSQSNKTVMKTFSLDSLWCNQTKRSFTKGNARIVNIIFIVQVIEEAPHVKPLHCVYMCVVCMCVYVRVIPLISVCTRASAHWHTYTRGDYSHANLGLK